jgi:glutaredoxin
MLFKAIRLILTPILTGLDKLTSPKSMERSSELQQLVDDETKQLVLYQYPSCPFCIKVRRQIKRLGLKIEIRDAKSNEQHKKELLSNGGKNQVPCLKISANDEAGVDEQWMYESSAINDFLEQKYAHRV